MFKIPVILTIFCVLTLTACIQVAMTKAKDISDYMEATKNSDFSDFKSVRAIHAIPGERYPAYFTRVFCSIYNKENLLDALAAESLIPNKPECLESPQIGTEVLQVAVDKPVAPRISHEKLKMSVVFKSSVDDRIYQQRTFMVGGIWPRDNVNLLTGLITNAVMLAHRPPKGPERIAWARRIGDVCKHAEDEIACRN